MRWLTSFAMFSGLLVLGCNQPVAPVAPTGTGTPASSTPATPAKKKVAHSHDDGPHGGEIIDFGPHHLEYVFDFSKKQVTLYILDEEMENAVPIAVEKLALSLKNPVVQIEVKAMPQEKDPKGKSSRFVGTNDALAKEGPLEGTISGELEGKPYAEDFKFKPKKK